jgi:hypothetical protein
LKISNTFKTFALATAATLALSAPALGIPAGDEYIPSVPGGNGGQPTDAGGWPGPIPSSITGKASKDKGEPKDSANSPVLADSADAAAADDQDDSSGVLDTLLSPVVLLLAAGLITIAVAMSLIRREDGTDPMSRARRSSADAPPTPDGQIVGGEQRL